MTREELEVLLTLPEHKIVEVQFKRPDIKVLFKCGFPLSMNQETDEGGLVVSEHYSGTDFAIVKGSDIVEHPSSEYFVGRIVRIVENNTENVSNWLIAKVDETQHEEYANQENRIAELHAKLDVIWDVKDGTTKLDILFDEYLAAEQSEAAIIDETVE